MLHHIQKGIINILASKDPARYADLKPSDMDGNQFTYHLKQLIVAKRVEQNDDGTYSLTQKGKAYLVTRYEEPEEAAHTIFLAVIRHGDKLLLRERLIQPSQGMVGFVHGEPTANMPLEESIKARVVAKTGLEVHDVTPVSSGLIRFMRNGQVESFSHAIIVTAVADEPTVPVEQEVTGRNFWVEKAEIDSVENLLPSCRDVLKSIESSAAWFDWTYEL
jgi:hypothetical protein